MVIRLLKGAKTSRPGMPKCQTTWDTDIVIKYLKHHPYEDLKQLSSHLVTLVALVTAQRMQTISKFKLSNIVFKEAEVKISVLEPLKNRKEGTIVTIKAFNEDHHICPVTLLKDYIDQTAQLRHSDLLFISFVKPHNAVHIDTLRRWVLRTMSAAGVDINMFKAHSTRSAAASKAKRKEVPLQAILDSAMWKSSSTFAKYYDKDCGVITEELSVQNAVLNV